ncbi:unnamed protein product, partial [Ectocarpus fasciculatus]
KPLQGRRPLDIFNGEHETVPKLKVLQRCRKVGPFDRLVELVSEYKPLQGCWPLHRVDRHVETGIFTKLDHFQPSRPRHGLKASTKDTAELQVVYVRQCKDRCPQLPCCRHVPRNAPRSLPWHACLT